MGLVASSSSRERPSSEPIANYFGLKGTKTPVVSVGKVWESVSEV